MLERGEIMFRSLSYFRDIEDGGVRQDEFEGTLRHRPKGGLVITKENGEQLTLPHRFESIVKEDKIFVCCFSTQLSIELARTFGADSCVEIPDAIKLLGKIRSALRLRSAVDRSLVPAGVVRYYNDEEPPLADWALPEKIAMSKRAEYESQQEFRIAFAEEDAFKVKNVTVQLVEGDGGRPERQAEHPYRLLKVGPLFRGCTLHSFQS